MDKEKERYFKRKWRKEHIPLFVLLVLIAAAPVAAAFIIGKPFLAGFTPIICLAGYAYQNNRMMIYVEDKLYG